MKWLNYFSRKRKVFTREDGAESDLIQYALDHHKAAKLLYNHSKSSDWQYLHSAAYLSQLSIELIIKASLLDLVGEYSATHDLKRLFKRLHRANGAVLSNDNAQWLKKLHEFQFLRYPNPNTDTTVSLSHWEKTESLFDNLRQKVPNNIQHLIVIRERYLENEKSGKVI